ncbi:hypothetical protein [Halomonas ramblicola]|uniref:hypothetical protein n=1 Tax=Halomonas ramblicola TaxID=747349 RepID=UPI0025B39EFD|nr:hypothetical protein [Halomonas ramblicola]MDN3523561.1 hypothetical protein [Halomonas ramblicola]
MTSTITSRRDSLLKGVAMLASLLFSLTFSTASSIAGDVLDDAMLERIRDVSVHEYTPPPDGSITQRQVDDFIRVSERAARLEARYAKHANAMQLAKIDAVSEEGANWAEYQWVRSQLKQAAFSQAMNAPPRDAASRHNAALFMANEDRLQVILRLESNQEPRP